MKALRLAIVCLLALGGCAIGRPQTPVPAPASPSKPAAEAPPDLAPEMRIVSLPVNDDLEELATYSRIGLPLDIYASITAGEEPVVARVVSKATLITILRSPDAKASSVMLAVPKDDVEMLVLTRELVRRRQASFYLAAAPRAGSAQTGKTREQGLQLRQMMTRLGYEIPDKKPESAPPAVAAA